MPGVPVFTEEQLAFIQPRYMRHKMQPRDLVPAVNEKFGTSYTKKQILNLVRDRGWSTRRRKTLAKVMALESAGRLAERQMLTDLQTVQQRIIETQLRIGEKVLTKAEQFIDTASSAKTLSTAAGAAKTGAAMAREATGLNGQNGGNTTNYTFNFSRSGSSPFSTSPEPVAAVEPVDVEALESE